jgi:hypothetical protein
MSPIFKIFGAVACVLALSSNASAQGLVSQQNIPLAMAKTIAECHGQVQGNGLQSLLGPGRLTATELRDHMDALAKHLSDPSTTLIDRLVVQAWGTKPN